MVDTNSHIHCLTALNRPPDSVPISKLKDGNMTMTAASRHISTVRHSIKPEHPLHAIARRSDNLFFLTLAVSGLLSLVIGYQYNTFGLALGVAPALVVLGALAYLGMRATLASCLTLAFCNAGMVMLQIQLGRGTVEFHFGVFVLLALLLAYRDWRPILFTAALFAVHHVLFDRLQAMGLGFYCTPSPDFLKMVAHALYVVVQTGIELMLAHFMRIAALQGAELAAIVSVLDSDARVALSVEGVQVSTAGGLALKKAVLKVKDALGSIADSGHTITDIAERIAEAACTAQRTEKASTGLQQVAVSIGEITQNMSQSADASSQANKLSHSASAAAQQGAEVVHKLVETIEGIQVSSKRIAEITSMIDGIAFQTNILALNAAVEAARAGEQGRGFAVVAGEVRTLAQRAASAAKEIQGLINDSVVRINDGAQLAENAGTSIDSIVESVRNVESILTEIAQSTQRQSEGITHVNDVVLNLDADAQLNSSLVDQLASTSTHLRDQAQALWASIESFDIGSSGKPVLRPA
jgi:methyl-accepting chemotaxis protein